jgi:acylphosphatase
MRTATRIIVRLNKRDTGFRFYAYKRGKVLGIHGFITYYGDKQDIAIHAEGKNVVLQRYISILRLGKPFSKVISIMSIPDRMLNSDCFEILPTVMPEAGFQIEKPPLIGFKIGLFGF